MPASAALSTERLTLRRLTPADIPALVAGLNDYAVSRWLTVVPYPYGPADAEAFLAHLDQGGRFEGYGLAIGDGPVLGVIVIDDSLGFWLARPHHRQGYMTEAARVLVEHYFAETGAAELRSGYFDGNTASARVLAKLGFCPAGESRVRSRAQGIDVKLKNVVLTRTAWEARHG